MKLFSTTFFATLLTAALALSPWAPFSLGGFERAWDGADPFESAPPHPWRPAWSPPREFLSPENLFYPSLSTTQLRLALRDAEFRVSKGFHVPAKLEENVFFWLKIYAQYSSREVVFYDRFHPEVIYEILDLRPLYHTSRSERVAEILREHRIRDRIGLYQKAFRNIERVLGKSSLPSAVTKVHLSKLSQLERGILKTLQSSPHGHHPLSHWSKGFRAQTGQRDQIIRGLHAIHDYLGPIEEIFQTVGVPRELVRLSLVESSFNPLAHSRAHARGVWQFLIPSGKEYMIVEPRHLDERVSPLKSSVAAARLLKRNYNSLKLWPLAITSYHHGIRNLLKLQPEEREGVLTGELFQPCSTSRRLGFASKSYYAEFLAILHAEAYGDLLYGEPKGEARPQYGHVLISQSSRASEVAPKHGMPSETKFRQYNRDFFGKWDDLLPTGYLLATPMASNPQYLVQAIYPRSKRVKHAEIALKLTRPIPKSPKRRQLVQTPSRKRPLPRRRSLSAQTPRALRAPSS